MEANVNVLRPREFVLVWRLENQTSPALMTELFISSYLPGHVLNHNVLHACELNVPIAFRLEYLILRFNIAILKICSPFIALDNCTYQRFFYKENVY